MHAECIRRLAEIDVGECSTARKKMKNDPISSTIIYQGQVRSAVVGEGGQRNVVEEEDFSTMVHQGQEKKRRRKKKKRRK